MNILIIGSGGREHVLAWKIKQSPLVDNLYCAPGNGGIASLAQCVDIAVDDMQGLVQFAKEKQIDLTVVGPEAPLVDGIADIFQEHQLKVFGPGKLSAQLEGSKVFAKKFMRKYNIPTASFEIFDTIQKALHFLEHVQFPIVVKADGLAAGKGVIICKDIKEAREALEQMMEQEVFKEAGKRVIIEECLVGEEVSILAVSDGKNYCILDSSQDHKRIFDNDVGPNTGGMGAYSPAPIVDSGLLKEIKALIIAPSIRGMEQEGTPFKGILYAGLMVTVQGPMVLEFNVRFGDPEAQAVLPRMKNDIVEMMMASCEGRINKIRPSWDPRSCVCVVMSSGGYPGKYETGMEITGLNIAEKDEETVIFHAGTKKQNDKIVSSGGRVLGVMSMGSGIEETIERVYKAVDTIKFDHCFFRRDIGVKALRRLTECRG
jgi:phosphoribosylamine---glycine ligase